MKLNNHGLTVGELTIAISVIIIVTLIWSAFNKKQDSTEKSMHQSIDTISSPYYQGVPNSL